ncbi:DUF3011 domain-containing protein [Montanilutibacter psychrotolerans]|uniref:DUF3011 domain-containing protein n=1 Tax=Montanilutibacter psychrotolerans TaxID=1327343 RepID=A0A3M8SUL3_9GAMM|nr:DUF3011 domain-containing protein [Lysobacter psychrotolerans]RNF83166.1 DUF3011 domain-containing protein [Lysobacter psychrotolerans]
MHKHTVATLALMVAVLWPARDAVAQQAERQPGGRYLQCESIGGRTRECAVAADDEVQLSRQLSRMPCVEGRSWGRNRDAIWVSSGCRAQFAVTGHGEGRTLRCESRDGRSTHCPADTREGVQLQRQLSKSQCIFGEDWGWDEQAIWVTDGCRADFLVPGGRHADAAMQRVRCESKGGGHASCDADAGPNVRLLRQLSDAPCVEGQSWGVRPGEIWVDHGCRGDFEFQRATQDPR